MMRKYSLIMLAALMSSSAFAADLPVKARPRVKDTPPNPFIYTGSGPYGFIGTEGGAGSANVNVPGLNSNSITTTTIDAHIGVGYVWATSTGGFWGLEARAGWQNFNGNSPGLALTGPLAFEQNLYFGIPLAQLQQVLPNFFNITPPPFSPPNGITITNTNWYLGVTVDERDISINFGDLANRDWAIAPGVKLGQQNLLSNGLMADVYAKVRFDSLGFCTGPSVSGTACVNLGTSYLAGVNFKFGI